MPGTQTSNFKRIQIFKYVYNTLFRSLDDYDYYQDPVVQNYLDHVRTPAEEPIRPAEVEDERSFGVSVQDLLDVSPSMKKRAHREEDSYGNKAAVQLPHSSGSTHHHRHRTQMMLSALSAAIVGLCSHLLFRH